MYIYRFVNRYIYRCTEGGVIVGGHVTKWRKKGASGKGGSGRIGNIIGGYSRVTRIGEKKEEPLLCSVGRVPV